MGWEEMKMDGSRGLEFEETERNGVDGGLCEHMMALTLEHYSVDVLPGRGVHSFAPLLILAGVLGSC